MTTRFDAEAEPLPRDGFRNDVTTREQDGAPAREPATRLQPHAQSSGRPDRRGRNALDRNRAERRGRFAVAIRFTAAMELTLEVEAGSKQEAEATAIKLVQTPDFRGATVTRKVLKVRKTE